MHNKAILLLTIFGSTGAMQSHSTITLDGSLGRADTLIGPDYQIGPELGQQQGGNLFHSFQDFNLQSHESATFSGPDTVHNIITRVTGGNPSNIDGTLRSTIPNADFYLLNPYGILFGPHASFDLQGGFHVSTADYLSLSDGGRFAARNPNNTLLTTAPVAAFGFLTEAPAPIKTQDSRLLVPNSKTFSWIGGGVEFIGSEPPIYDYDYGIPTLEGHSWILADAGRINIISVSSPGEVILSANHVESTAKGGNILMFNTDVITHHQDEGGGNIFVRGGVFELFSSELNNNTLSKPGGILSIQVDSLTLGGDSIESSIETESYGTAQGGYLHVQARDIELKEGGFLSSSAYSSGQGGTILIEVLETLKMSGISPRESLLSSGIFAISDTGEIEHAGNAGDLIIQARNIELSAGAQIGTATFGTGQGGTIVLKAMESLKIIGQNKYYNSGIFVSSINYQLEHAGNAGYIHIEAAQIILQDGGKIASNTYGAGQGGAVHLQVADHLTVSGRGIVDNSPSGIYAGSLNINDLYKDEASLEWFLKEGLSAGQAGEIVIQAPIFNILDGGQVSAQQTRDTGGGGGNISLSIAERLYLHQGQITTSVKGGEGNSGNITIEKPQFIILNSGQITAQADAGRGGNIRIVADHLLTTPDSLISASSRLGIDGQIEIISPDVSVSNGLLGLSNQLKPVELTLKHNCRIKTWEEIMNLSTFFAHTLAGHSRSPLDLQ